MPYLDSVSDLSVTRIADANCSGSVDLRMRWSTAIGAGVAGQYQCSTLPTPPTICSHGDVIFNTDAMATCQTQTNPLCPHSDGVAESGELDFFREVVACHEVGHGVGFHHHDRTDNFFTSNGNDCTVSGWLEIQESGNGWHRYNNHHLSELNTFV
jgi:hypothetical protein